MIAGYVDGFGLLTLGTFLSFMSGNTTLTGTTAGKGLVAQMAPPAAAIGLFVLGVFVGTVVNRRLTRDRPRLAALAGVGGLLILASLLPWGASVIPWGASLTPSGASLTPGAAHSGWLYSIAMIGVISFAMGAMNTTLSHVGHEPLNLTFVTGALNRIGTHLALAASGVPLADPEGPWDSQSRRAMRLAGAWTGFFGGAVLAGLATPRLEGWTLVPPAVILILLSPFAIWPEGARPNPGLQSAPARQ